MADTLLVHATTVAIDNRAVLLRGPAGSGKSDLALRLIDAGARLVADDRSELRRDGDAILVSAPQTIAGLIEVRGIGILRVDFLASVRLSLVVDLVAPQAVERMPEQLSETILGLAVPVLVLSPFEASAPAKLRFALDVLTGGGATRIRR